MFSETRGSFISSLQVACLYCLTLPMALASVSKVTLGNRSEAGHSWWGPSQEWHCNSWLQGSYISSFWGSSLFLLCWELFVVSVCLLICKFLVRKMKPRPCIYAQQDIFKCHKVVLDFYVVIHRIT